MNHHVTPVPAAPILNHGYRAARTLAVLLVFAGCQGALAQTVNDAWSSKVAILDENGVKYLAPIHASLLPDGTVMLKGWTQDDEEPLTGVPRRDSFTAILDPDDYSGLSLPPSTNLTTYAEPVVYDMTGQGNTIILDTLFCSGHVLQHDGKLFVAGGLRKFDWEGIFEEVFTHAIGGGGLPYACSWDWTTNTWTRIDGFVGTGEGGAVLPWEVIAGEPLFAGPERYYPTATKLPDGRILIIGGSQVLELTVIQGDDVSSYFDLKNLSVEVYDPTITNPSFTEISTIEQTPPIVFNPDYTHTFALPSEVFGRDVLLFGSAAFPAFMSSVPPVNWGVLEAKRPGDSFHAEPNDGASTAMLPLRLPSQGFGYNNGSVIVAGGEGDYHDEVDVFDAAALAWPTQRSLATDRHHCSTVLLPTGEVLVVAGHNDSPDDPVLLNAEYVDVRNSFTMKTGSCSSYKVRGYHTVSLLLPDGRVFVGGGKLGGVQSGPPLEKANFELLHPPYMLAPSRPAITAGPGGNVNYGMPFSIGVDVPELSEAVLISLGSMTHSIDMNQRYVQLHINSVTGSGGSYTASIDGPSSADLAPPGHYMLFVLDTNLVPSEAVIVLVS